MAKCSHCSRIINEKANFCPYCGQPVSQPVATQNTSLDTPCIRRELEQAGWKDVKPSSYMGIDFDCVGSRKALGMVQWNVLVKFVPNLDAEAIKMWTTSFQQLNKNAQSWIQGKGFILCLVAKEIDPAVLSSIQSHDFGLFGIFRMKGGGGTVLISDEKNRQVYGEIPRLPRDVHNYMTSTMKALIRCLNAEVQGAVQ